MYAIIETGGKQYRVEVGQELDVERLGVQEGAYVFSKVLLLAQDDGQVQVGHPTVPGCTVRAVVVGERRGKKIRGFKYKAKSNYRRRYGHRQWRTRVRIEAIEV